MLTASGVLWRVYMKLLINIFVIVGLWGFTSLALADEESVYLKNKIERMEERIQHLE